MKKLKLLILLLFALVSVNAFAQETTTVTAQGLGTARADALQDALRNAIGQATGVALSSTTQVENFAVISDAIATNQKGYIKSYDVVSEGKEGENYQVTVKAVVSLSVLKADAQLLYKSIGGVRFLVMYNTKKKPKEDLPYYDFAVSRINTYLSKRNYRYIDQTRAKALQREAANIAEESSNGVPLTYVQQLGLLSDAQFIIFINNVSVEKKSEKFDTRKLSRLTIDFSTYDNCTAEGLGTLHFESPWVNDEGDKTRFQLITGELDQHMDEVLNTFNTYIGGWVTNGTPFEIRFYQSGTYRELRDLRDKLKADKNFGGDLEIVSADNYTKLNCTFRRKPDELADKVLDISDEIPAMKAKRMDVKLIYGRQISFAPTAAKIPALQHAKEENPEMKDTPIEAAPVPAAKSNNSAKAPAKKASVTKKPVSTKKITSKK